MVISFVSSPDTLSKTLSPRDSRIHRIMNLSTSSDGRMVGPCTPSLPRQRSLPENNAQGTQHHLNGFKVLVGELKARQFDRIRFAAYRTASKLRYIQKRTQFVLVDLWNVIEAFRQVGLNAVDSLAELEVAATEEVLRAIYAQLNKRLPAERRVDAQECIDILLSWILHTYDPSSRSFVRVLSLKVVLSTLASGKSIDKFKYHFTLLSDPSGGLVPQKFEQYLHDLLSLAVGVFEGSNFTYDSESSKFMLNGKSRTVVIEEYLDRMMMDPGPQCLLWLTIFHRCSHVERVRHQVRCSVCGKEPIIGFRYKCQRCHNFSLCQECFWTGAVAGSHTLQHEVKEYTAWKTHSRQFGHSLRRSFHCGKPSNSNSNSNSTMKRQYQQQQQQQQFQQHYLQQPQHIAQVRRMPSGTTTDLNAIGQHMAPELRNPRMEGIIASCSHPAIHASTTSDRQVVVPSPSRSLAGHPLGVGSQHPGSGSPPLALPPSSVSGSPPLHHGEHISSHNNHSGTANRPAGFPFDPNCVDDEHRLISRYASRLAADVDLPLGVRSSKTSTGEILIPPTSVKDQRALIAKLEAKNREILKEIQRLRLEQQAAANGPGLLGGCSSPSAVTNNPTLLVELRALRQRKDELETRMGNLQDSRKELMLQLESLMKLLKAGGGKESATNGSVGLPPSSTASQRTTPVSGSPLRSLSVPCSSALVLPSTALAGGNSGVTTPGFSYGSVPASPQPFIPGGAYAPGMAPGSLRRDLLLAADSVTTAMSSLVRELNSDASSPEEGRTEAMVASIGVGGAAPGTGLYEAECERALEDMSRGGPAPGMPFGPPSGAHNGLQGPGGGAPGGSWQRRRQLQEQRFLSELRARRHQRSGSYTPGGYGNAMTSSMASGGDHSGGASSDGEAFLYSDPECTSGPPGYGSFARNFTDDEMELTSGVGKLLRGANSGAQARYGSIGRGGTGSGMLVTAQDDSGVTGDYDGSLMRDDIPRSMGWSVPTTSSSSCLNSR